MPDLTHLNGTLWLAEPRRLAEALERIAMIPTCPTAREIVQARRERLEIAFHAASAAAAHGGGRRRIGIVPIHGPIEQRLGAASLKLGGTSTEEAGAMIDVLSASSAVDCIVLHVDSPGGSVAGIEELSDQVYLARKKKPIYAICDSLMASAAYWIGSAATQVIATPGGEVGSVGVYCLHVDQSGAMKKEGLKVTLISAGKYKTEANPFEPLGTDARAHLQSGVDEVFTRFLSALARNRGSTVAYVRDHYGQGRVLSATAALKARMVDRIEAWPALLTRVSSTPSASTASAQVLRLRHAQARRKTTLP